MTQQSDRLDRLEALLEAMGQRLDETGKRLDRVVQITESNARAIQATDARMEEDHRVARQTMDDLNSFVRSLTVRALENLNAHEDFKQEMREFRDAMNKFSRWLQQQ